MSPYVEDEIRALEGGWCSTPCRCLKCNKRWMAVWPLDLAKVDLDDPDSVNKGIDDGIMNLECPNCGQQGFTIETTAEDLANCPYKEQ